MTRKDLHSARFIWLVHGSVCTVRNVIRLNWVCNVESRICCLSQESRFFSLKTLKNECYTLLLNSTQHSSTQLLVVWHLPASVHDLTFGPDQSLELSLMRVSLKAFQCGRSKINQEESCGGGTSHVAFSQSESGWMGSGAELPAKKERGGGQKDETQKKFWKHTRAISHFCFHVIWFQSNKTLTCCHHSKHHE